MNSIVHHQSVEGNIFSQDNFHLIDKFVIENFFLQNLMKDFLRLIEIYEKVSMPVQDDYHIDDLIESLN